MLDPRATTQQPAPTQLHTPPRYTCPHRGGSRWSSSARDDPQTKRSAARLATGLETIRCRDIASGEKTSAGHGKTGEPKASHAATTREPKPTSRIAMTTLSYESASATSWNNLPVNTTTEANAPVGTLITKPPIASPPTSSGQRLRFQLQAHHNTAPQVKGGLPAALVNCKPLLGGSASTVMQPRVSTLHARLCEALSRLGVCVPASRYAGHRS